MSQWVTSRKDRELWAAATLCARFSLVSFSFLTETEKCYPHRSYVCSRKHNFGFIDMGCLRLRYCVSILTIGVQSTIHVSFSEGDQFNFTHSPAPPSLWGYRKLSETSALVQLLHFHWLDRKYISPVSNSQNLDPEGKINSL